VLAKIDPEYVKQHGSFSPTTTWASRLMDREGTIRRRNWMKTTSCSTRREVRVTWSRAWRGKLKHKINIWTAARPFAGSLNGACRPIPGKLEKGLHYHSPHQRKQGLISLDCSAEDYWTNWKRSWHWKIISSTNPFAFLLNPRTRTPMKMWKHRENTARNMKFILPSGTHRSGCGKDDILAFPREILNISRIQAQEP